VVAIVDVPSCAATGAVHSSTMGAETATRVEAGEGGRERHCGRGDASGRGVVVNRCAQPFIARADVWRSATASSAHGCTVYNDLSSDYPSQRARLGPFGMQHARDHSTSRRPSPRGLHSTVAGVQALNSCASSIECCRETSARDLLPLAHVTLWSVLRECRARPPLHHLRHPPHPHHPCAFAVSILPAASLSQFTSSRQSMSRGGKLAPEVNR